MTVILIACTLLLPSEVGAKGIKEWCSGNFCLISHLPGYASQTGNKWLSKDCFK